MRENLSIRPCISNFSQMEQKKIAILGSTGSIGTQALDVVARNRNLYKIKLLTANNNADLLISQALEFQADNVVICNESLFPKVSFELASSGTKVYSGVKAVSEILSSEDIDMVLTAMVGFSGLEPTITAINNGRDIALANKETLVAGGSLVTSLLKNHPEVSVVPVDSEHSAIFQCLKGEGTGLSKILLTASGGPFLWTSASDLQNVTRDDALNHPKWNMGAKVTIDSASMMNKGFEMIEARWLFDVQPDDIEIVIHPQSIIHSMVEFVDGSIIAQMGVPDMRLPIQYAFTHPERIHSPVKRVDFAALGGFTFLKPDREKFPCIDIAYDSIRKGGNVPCIMNAANEIAVQAFLNGSLPFVKIPELIRNTIEKVSFIQTPSLEDILSTDREGRRVAEELAARKK